MDLEYTILACRNKACASLVYVSYTPLHQSVKIKLDYKSHIALLLLLLIVCNPDVVLCTSGAPLGLQSAPGSGAKALAYSKLVRILHLSV